ncbi:single-stranded DNA-binding protein [Paenarthrobacter sp. 2TAF44]|uniref:single-stranded DNA-binding protein n=1 Tax=Paenarthrobacter sp. 2TAF44 TaxID=3233018 RepID=UPI003F9DCB62
MDARHPVDGFTLSPRKYVDLEEFGRIGNPSGVINVPAPDPYDCAAVNYPVGTQDLPPWPIGTIWDPFATEPDIADRQQPEESDDPAPQNDISKNTENETSARGQGTIMAGETTITVIGNLTSDPELRFTPSGSAVANFTIASTPRTFDRQANEWKDGETLFLRASVWREAAENVAESLTKGTRVIVSGRLKSRSYETKEGEKRTVVELEVDEIGPSLRYANAKVNRTQRNNQGAGNAGGFGNQPTTGQVAQQDDPWAANSQANAGSWGNGPDSDPPF